MAIVTGFPQPAIVMIIQAMAAHALSHVAVHGIRIRRVIMTRGAGALGMLTNQWKPGLIMIELRAQPARWCVAIAAPLAEAAIVGVVLLMAADTLPGRFTK